MAKQITKDNFLESLDALKCSLCLDSYDASHVPVELECGHVFGDHCIANAVESETQNNNRCPLCRRELFEQEDFDEDGELIRDNDDDDDDTEDELEDPRPGVHSLTQSERDDLDQVPGLTPREREIAVELMAPELVVVTSDERLLLMRPNLLTSWADREENENREREPAMSSAREGDSHGELPAGPAEGDFAGLSRPIRRPEVDIEDEEPPLRISTARLNNTEPAATNEEQSEDSDSDIELSDSDIAIPLDSSSEEEQLDEDEQKEVVMDNASEYNSSESEYEPNEDDGESDHENDDHWRAKLRPEDGGNRRETCARRV